MEFLDDISKGVQWLVDVLSNFFNDLMKVLDYATKAVASIGNYFSFLPEQYVAVLLLALAIALIYLFVGRE